MSQAVSQREVQDQQERAHEQTLEQITLQNGQQPDDPNKLHADLLQTLTDTNLSEGSKNLLRNWISKDFILANWDTDETHRLKWDLEIKRLEYLDMHPGEECLVVGRIRAYANDDPHSTLKPLSPEEIGIINGFFEGVFARITRGEGGFQQEMMNKSITESHVNRSDNDGGGGLLRRWRNS